MNSEQGDAVARRSVVDLLTGRLRLLVPPEDSFSRLEAALIQGVIRQVEALPPWTEAPEHWAQSRPQL